MFERFFGDVKSPVNLQFKALQDNWAKIKKRASTNRMQISTRKFPWLALLKQNSISLLNKIMHDSLKESTPRDDYRKMAELTLIVLSKYDGKATISACKKPGTIRKARWMQKVIYSFKMFLYQDQLLCSGKTKDQLKSFVMFSILLYFPVWFNALSAVNAPVNDLQLFKDLSRCAN